MDHRRPGTLQKAFAKLKEKAGQLLGHPRTVDQPRPAGQRQAEDVERELRETYDKPTDAIQARSGFRQ
jgi:hypothetical protein